MKSQLITDTKFQYDDLSYYESGSDYVDLYIKEEFAGYIEVWHDDEMEGSEYIIINDEIIYLDEMELINPESLQETK